MKDNIKKILPCSVVIPVCNEADNIASLLSELDQIMQGWHSSEVIVVDDHSTDQTLEILQRYRKNYPWLRIVQLDKQSGQSAALRYGIKKAGRSLIVTLDGDGQNDPADITHLVEMYHKLSNENTCYLINGYRIRRKDSPWRRFSSLVANAVRSRLLNDNTPDSGCGIKALPKELYLDLPAFDHMHRFIPALVRQQGGKIVSVEVNHRPRAAGNSHYGTLDRLFAGIIDICGVLWLGRRNIQCGLAREEQHGK